MKSTFSASSTNYCYVLFRIMYDLYITIFKYFTTIWWTKTLVEIFSKNKVVTKIYFSRLIFFIGGNIVNLFDTEFL